MVMRINRLKAVCFEFQEDIATTHEVSLGRGSTAFAMVDSIISLVDVQFSNNQEQMMCGWHSKNY